MMDLSKVRSYYIACGYTDLRLGIDGLVAVVTQQYDGQLNEESLFLFCGRRTDRIKALYWTGDGYILLYKRLSNGRFQWPRSEAELKLLDPQSFRWLMEGLRIEQKTAIRPFTLGRKNWLFCDTTKGAEASAIVYSLVESAKVNGVEPFAYLQHVLLQLPYLGKTHSHQELESLMPWAPYIQQEFGVKNSDAYVNTYLD